MIDRKGVLDIPRTLAVYTSRGTEISGYLTEDNRGSSLSAEPKTKQIQDGLFMFGQREYHILTQFSKSQLIV